MSAGAPASDDDTTKRKQLAVWLLQWTRTIRPDPAPGAASSLGISRSKTARSIVATVSCPGTGTTTLRSTCSTGWDSAVGPHVRHEAGWPQEPPGGSLCGGVTLPHAGTSATGRTGDPVAPTNFNGMQTKMNR